MSTVTDRLDQNLITLAKQRYETQQKLSVPGYVVTLPSRGIIYPKSSPLHQGSVEMRHMTAYEEDILTNESYQAQNIMLEKLIESLIQTPGINVGDLHNRDFEKLVIAARAYGYGPIYPVNVIDPKTGNVLQRNIDLTKIPDKEFNLTADENSEFDYITSNNDTLKFKYLSINELKKLDSQHMIFGVVTNSIQSINGNRDRNAIEKYVKYDLIASESKKFRQHMISNIFGVNFELEFEGEDGGAFTSTFQLNTDVFWT